MRVVEAAGALRQRRGHGGCERDERAKPLSASADDVAGHVRYGLDRACCAIFQQLFDDVYVCCDQGVKTVQWRLHFRRVFDFGVESQDRFLVTDKWAKNCEQRSYALVCARVQVKGRRTSGSRNRVAASAQRPIKELCS